MSSGGGTHEFVAFFFVGVNGVTMRSNDEDRRRESRLVSLVDASGVNVNAAQPEVDRLQWSVFAILRSRLQTQHMEHIV